MEECLKVLVVAGCHHDVTVDLRTSLRPQAGMTFDRYMADLLCHRSFFSCKRLPKRLLFAERLETGEDPGPGQPAQHWQKSLRDDFKAFRALHGSTPTDRRTFGVDKFVWTEAARKGEGVPWCTGVLLGAERFMASWRKSEEEASKLREVNRAA